MDDEVKSSIQKYWKKILKGRWIKSLVPWGRVSKLHLLEAKERYRTLYRIVGYYKSTYKCDERVGRDKNDEEICKALNDCGQVLAEAKALRTTRQEDLNSLWRELTRVRIVLFEKIIPLDELQYQLDFCREEAQRLAVLEDPQINEMLQKLAEAMDEQGKNDKRVKRVLRAMYERFNTIRTARIYQQHINIRTYKISLLVLFLISIILVANVHLLVEGAKNVGTINLETFTLESSFKFVSNLLEKNVLAFVFLGGLTGGFFSVVIRVRDQNLIPGEDAYFLWYVLTKPFVGALGAVILYVLFQSNFVSFELFKDLPNEADPKVFGFAFLSGFTERIVFPNFR